MVENMQKQDLSKNDEIVETSLILNPNGSIYHLGLHPGELAETIFLVGDPDRVPKVSCYFDSIELTRQKRELITHTGYVGKQRVSVVSTGMSTDNIDIVMNEIDALFNIDFQARKIKPEQQSLRLIRLGTSGGLQKEIPVDSIVVSRYSVGFDGLLPFYERSLSQDEADLTQVAQYALGQTFPCRLYASKADEVLVETLTKTFEFSGITATCGGFYAPQGRILRAAGSVPNLVERLNAFRYRDQRFINFEMETAAIFGLGALLGHRCCSLNAIIANRITEKFSQDMHKTVDRMIQGAIQTLF